MTLIDTIKKDFDLPLKPYLFQLKVLEQIKYWKASGLYCDCGTGKTLISTYKALYDSIINKSEHILVICPPILISQWGRWLRSLNLEVLEYKGTKKKRSEYHLRDYDCIIVGYQILQRDIEKFLLHLYDTPMSIIVDEAQALKNSGTKNYNNIRNLYDGNKFNTIQLLTGTPLSTPLDAYSYISFTSPSEYRSYIGFELKHVSDYDFYGNPVSFKNLDHLNSVFYEHGIKIEADDVVDLPDIIRLKNLYTLSPKHYRLYKKLISEQVLELENGDVIDATDYIRLFHYSQQIINNPGMFGLDIKPASVELIEEIIDEIPEDEKVVVYAGYQMVNRYVLNSVPNSVGLWGEYSHKQQEENLKAFIEGDARILVANPKSGGVGLNLQDVCRNMIFLEFPIPFSNYHQAEARIYRNGQKKKCRIWNLIAEGTVQENIFESVMNKEDIVNQILNKKRTIKDIFF